MNKKQSLRPVKGTVSQPQAQEKIYIGNKIKYNNQLANGGSYKKRYGGEGSCGCGSDKNPKRIGKYKTI
ncbi:hypothetical protein [Bacillus benzoevorans]|uniref:Uncharacterized protein n=1 Tax=Bacillus benzoevorans TaxID=1456 RepID=A0A7X0HT19_9BACI|nr:hypothetical protein [Bacillus benzoevorans]MBB6445220.1 hypothetical protein [Bacillus benzoevorans]